MKLITKFKALVFLGLLITISCSEDDNNIPNPTVGSGIKIMPLGDSRIEGARPEFESYRYELWKNLVTNNWEFDFTGPLKDDASYPQFMNMSFDNDHAGVGGFTTRDIINNIQEALTSGTPDVVLIGIGGNDLTGGSTVSNAITNINQIIDILQGSNNNITIFLEQIAPGRSDFMTPEFTALFNEFNSSITGVGDQQTTTTSKVIVVDMATGWKDTYMADEVHYNVEGAKVVADRYYNAITQFIEKQ
ncbi:SGNH/GDSL hydrolase family protein [Aquimarina sp. 2304DJ70-9]|uniref:SGNH/GDSL hydrolase family protein n=1 Tax=Aquimarina penaris TaxID=3231044 RepID=UPI0034628E6C